MNHPTFEFHPEALREAWEARRWYADRDPRTAASFLVELDHAQKQVVAHPERWPVYFHGTRRYRLRRFPYLLVYHTQSERIVVLAVAHAKRRPGYWKARQPV
jgi:plasmid stabilization system protein ParE